MRKANFFFVWAYFGLFRLIVSFSLRGLFEGKFTAIANVFHRSTLIVVALILGCAKFEARMAIMGDDGIPIVVSFLLMGTCQVSIRLGKATPRHSCSQDTIGNSTIVGSVGHMEIQLLWEVWDTLSIMPKRQPISDYPPLDDSLVDGAGDSTMRNSDLFQRIEHSGLSLGQLRIRILDSTLITDTAEATRGHLFVNVQCAPTNNYTTHIHCSGLFQAPALSDTVDQSLEYRWTTQIQIRTGSDSAQSQSFEPSFKAFKESLARDVEEMIGLYEATYMKVQLEVRNREDCR
nr:hypothetical protein [Tanacetum cinerariifolium]